MSESTSVPATNKPLRAQLSTELTMPTLRSRIWRYRHYYVMMLLPMTFIAVFDYGPMVGLINAFRQYLPGGSWLGEQWVGFRYFEAFFNNDSFWRALKNNLILGILTVAVITPLPIIFALLLNEVESGPFKRFIQTSTYLPKFISVVVVVGIVKELLSPSTGFVNTILVRLGITPIYFLNDPQWFRTIYIFTDVWERLGWNTIVYLAALAGIDPQLYEAAHVDGANRWHRIVHITLPGIFPVIVILFILRTAQFVHVGFEKILLLYSESIYETADVLQTFVYRTGIMQGLYSYATAVGMFDSVLALFFVVLGNFLAKRLGQQSLW